MTYIETSFTDLINKSDNKFTISLLYKLANITPNLAIKIKKYCFENPNSTLTEIQVKHFTEKKKNLIRENASGPNKEPLCNIKELCIKEIKKINKKNNHHKAARLLKSFWNQGIDDGIIGDSDIPLNEIYKVVRFYHKDKSLYESNYDENLTYYENKTEEQQKGQIRSILEEYSQDSMQYYVKNNQLRSNALNLFSNDDLRKSNESLGWKIGSHPRGKGKWSLKPGEGILSIEQKKNLENDIKNRFVGSRNHGAIKSKIHAIAIIA